jgi:hypothetical protein
MAVMVLASAAVVPPGFAKKCIIFNILYMPFGGVVLERDAAPPP